MTLRLLAWIGLVVMCTSAYSQEVAKDSVVAKVIAKKKTFRPDIPGSILVEFGFNFKSGITPADFQRSFWGSRTVNFYYQYPIRLFRSKFSLNPGIGLSLERFKFSNDYTLGRQPDTDGTYPLIPARDIYPGSINRSFIVNNYVETPIELRFDTSPEDIARSFNVSVGYRFGVLYDSFTKVDYRDNGEDKSLKDKQWHGMNRVRQALYGRLGIGGFSVVMYYNFTPLFASGKGPEETAMNTYTIGISINGF